MIFLDEFYQICQIRSLYTILDIYEATSWILFQFKLSWKLDIRNLPIIYKREKTTCLKSWLKFAENMQKLKIWATWRNFIIKIFIILFIYFIIIIFNLNFYSALDIV